MINISKNKSDRIRQGDIISNVEYIEHVTEEHGVIEISKILFPYVFVLTQDCDLSQDNLFRTTSKTDDDKKIFSVLVAPMYNAEHFYMGEHLKDLNLTMTVINRKKTEGTYIKNNMNPRYHFLSFSETDIDIVDSIIDFKHYFSINIEYLYKIRGENYKCEVSPLFRELITQRFSNYLSRIGLPSAN